MISKNEGGLIWSKGPQDHQKGSMYRLVRVKGNSPVSFTCLSHDQWGTETHYYGGRTMPHMPAGCKACEAGRAIEWHGWVIGQLFKSDERAIIEYTAAAADAFIDAFSKFRSLKGVQFKLFRNNGRDNGRMIAEVGKDQIDSKLLPSVPAIMPIMMSIWQLKIEASMPTSSPRFLPGRLTLPETNSDHLSHD